MTAARKIRRSRLSWQRRALAAEAELKQFKLHTYPVERITIDNDFHGCDNRNSDYCSCNTWAPIGCVVCEEEIPHGEEAFHLYSATPWFGEWERGRWGADYWHIACDGGVNSGENDEAEPAVTPVLAEEVPF